MSKVRTTVSKSYTSTSSDNERTLPHVPCKILSWNIDGLNEVNLQSRIRAAIEVIVGAAPHIVVLQEVIHDIVPLIVRKLNEANYHCCELNAPVSPYFTMCFYSSEITCLSCVRSQFTAHAQSHMYRDILQCTLHFQNIQFTVLTSHLESCKESSSSRTAQLAQCFRTMLDIPNSAFLVGDLNMRDSEATAAVHTVQSSASVLRDAWIEVGKPPAAKHTWVCPGAPHVKCRFDRLYHNSNDVSVTSVHVIGSTDISDHYGLVVTLRLTCSAPRITSFASASSIPIAAPAVMTREELRIARLRALDSASVGSNTSDISTATPPAKRRCGAVDKVVSQIQSPIFCEEEKTTLLCPAGLDPEVFNALPVDIQREVLNSTLV